MKKNVLECKIIIKTNLSYKLVKKIVQITPKRPLSFANEYSLLAGSIFSRHYDKLSWASQFFFPKLKGLVAVDNDICEVGTI